jgi:indolepyruvate ferredoxin oxidoreductase beta subunit
MSFASIGRPRGDDRAGPAAGGAAPRAITVAILAMGGEGGGVLADWLVDLAEADGWFAQSTSVPGVAQRTGATIYYVELFPADAARAAGADPVLALMPVPGEVDVVIASELMEAGRAVQRGLVTDDRTTLVASTHRVYSMTEKTAMGDGRVDAAALADGCRRAAHRFVAADFARLAEDARSVISASLFGALAATGALPFARERFEAAVRRGGVGVEPSLAAFAAGYAAGAAAGHHRPDATRPQAAAPRLGPRLADHERRIVERFAPAAHEVLRAGVLRLADWQDEAHAADYLDRLAPVADVDAAAGPLPGEAPHALLVETARHLALWMSYEDAVRVADLKTRRSRFERVATEVRLADGQLLDVGEFLHPRLQEIADVLPRPIGERLLGTPWLARGLGRLVGRGRVVTTSSVRGYLQLCAVAALRRWRRGSLRFALERARSDDWLARVVAAAAVDPALALEIVRCQRLVKGYGDTHARGWGSFERLMQALDRLPPGALGAAGLHALREAALADEGGAALAAALARLDAVGGAPAAAPASAAR